MSWANEALMKMSDQSQADIAAIVEALNSNKVAGSALFAKLDKERGWKMWEALAVKDIALALYGACLGAKEVEPEGRGL